MRGLDREPVEARAVVLPLQALGLLGVSEEGALAIRAFGIGSRDLAGDLAEMTRRLERSGDPEAPAQLAVSRQIAAAAQSARGWLSLTVADGQAVPTLVLVCEEVRLVVRLLGVVAEWIPLRPAGLAGFVADVVDGAGTSDVLVTAFQGGTALAGLRVRDGRAEVAAREAGRLDRISRASDAGLSGLLDALVAELGS